MALRQEAAQNCIAIVRAVTGIADLIARDGVASDVLQTPESGTTQGRLNNPVALTARVTSLNIFPTFTLSNTQACAIFGYGTLAALPLIVVDDNDAIFRPAQRYGPATQSVLALGALGIFENLA